MPRKYSIAEARQQFAAVVHELDQTPLIELTRRGQPVAVLLSLAAYQQLTPLAASYWDAYLAFRSSISPTDLLDAMDPFARLRDRSPGREIEL
jgi:prevent-host-death family protein